MEENSQPLATDSFSYSWLREQSNLGPTLLPQNNHHNFNFDVPPITSLVHADEIFSNGHIMPVYIERSSKIGKPSSSSTSLPASSVSIYPSRSPFLSEYYLLRKWKRSSKGILRKCFGFVKPLCRAIGCSRKSNRINDLERKVFEDRSFNGSMEASPRPSSAYSAVELSDDFKKISDANDSMNVWSDAENSIHEAILYCKRSIEK